MMRNRAVVLALIALALAGLSAAAAAQPLEYSILLVDDDWDYSFTHPGSLGGRPYYISALEALGLGYEVWDVQAQGQPTGEALLDRDVVIWFTGYAYEDFEADPGVFTPQNESRVATYLDAGGRFLLSSQEYFYEADAITPFMDEHLGVQDISDVWVYTTTVGVAENPVGDGIGPLTLVRPDDFGEYWPPGNFEGPYDDEVYARPGAGTPFRYATTPFPPNSTNLEGPAFKTVFLGWPFEWVDTVNQRAQVLGSILRWLGLSWPIPEVPVLAPIENSDGDGGYLLDWSDSTGTIVYTVEEDDDPSFSTPATRYRGPESEFSVTLQPLGTWYYRVHASSPEGDSDWSNTEQVTVILAPPPAPTLEPIYNMDGDGSYLVDWNDVWGASGYTLQEDDNPDFSSPASYTGTDSQRQVTGQTAGTWYYRVCASNAIGDSPWSNVEWAGVLPEAPVLDPIENDDGDGDYLVDWSVVFGATSYSLQEDDNDGFASPAVRYSGVDSQYPVRQQRGGAWYYRVLASGAGGESPWSNVEVVYVVPAAPELKPIDNPDGNGEYVVEWTDVGRAMTYTLEEDSDPGFGAPTVRYAGPNSEFAVEGQPPGQWYYRVRAGNAGGDSPWSNAESVKVGEPQRFVFLPLIMRNR